MRQDRPTETFRCDFVLELVASDSYNQLEQPAIQPGRVCIMRIYDIYIYMIIYVHARIHSYIYIYTCILEERTTVVSTYLAQIKF